MNSWKDDYLEAWRRIENPSNFYREVAKPKWYDNDRVLLPVVIVMGLALMVFLTTLVVFTISHYHTSGGW